MKDLFKGCWTIPNLLSVIRILLIPVFAYLFYNDQKIAAVAILAFSGLTDMLDGKIARSRGLVTDFGKFLDPLADKMLTTAAFLGFIPLNIGAGVVWMAFIVLFREFAISSIRLIAVLLWVSTILCIISGVVYMLNNKDILKDTK